MGRGTLKRRWFRFSLRSLFVLLTVLAVWLAWNVNAARRRYVPINTSSRMPEADELVERALARPVSLSVDGELLEDLPALLRSYGVDAVLDHRAIADAGIVLQTPLERLEVSQVSLRSALRLLLRGSDLVATVRDGKLSITTLGQSNGRLTTKVYAVDDLIVTDQGTDADALVHVVTCTVAPTTWGLVGGPGSIVPFQGTIGVSQTPQAHRKLGYLLAALRKVRGSSLNPARPDRIWAEDSLQVAAFQRFEQKADARADVDIRRLPLWQAAATIGRTFNLPVVVDRLALEDAAVPPSTVVSCRLTQVSPAVALDTLLGDLDLAFRLKDEVVLITSKDQAELALLLAVYPVDDLIENRQDYDSLVDLIVTTVHPQTWDEVGGPAMAVGFPAASCLVVSQTRDVQEQILRLLAATRALNTPLPPPVKKKKKLRHLGSGYF